MAERDADDHDQKALLAHQKARRAKFLSWFWWAQVPLVGVTYWVISKEPMIEKMILVYLALVSIIANAVSYATKAEAAEAKAASHENP